MASSGRLLLLCLLLGIACELASGSDPRRLKKNKQLKKKSVKGSKGSKLKQLQEEKKELKEELHAVSKAKDALRQQVRESETANNVKAQRISELMQQLSNQESQISDLRSERAGQKPDSSKEQALADQSKLIASLRAQMSMQEKHVANLTDSLVRLRIKHEELLGQYDDPSVTHFLAAKAQKVYHHPGIEGAANKTFHYVVPAFEGYQDHLVSLYNATYSSIQDNLAGMLSGSSLADSDWLPAVSGFLVYAVFTLPVACGLTCLVEFVCRVKYILLAASFYLFVMSAGASAFVLYTGEDPLTQFAEQDATVYLWAQAGFGVIFGMYLILLIAIGVTSCMHEKSPFSEVCYRTMQCVALLIFGIVYFQLVWTPAMVDEMPKVEAFMAQFAKRTEPKAGQEVELEVRLMIVPYLLSNALFLLIFAVEEGIWHGGDKVTAEEKEEKSA